MSVGQSTFDDFSRLDYDFIYVFCDRHAISFLKAVMNKVTGKITDVGVCPICEKKHIGVIDLRIILSTFEKATNELRNYLRSLEE